MSEFHIERDFYPEFSCWDVKLDDGRMVTIWDDGDVVFDLDRDDSIDITFSHSILTEIINAANDYFVARDRYKNENNL